MASAPAGSTKLTSSGRRRVLAGACVGWLFAGVQMTTMQLASGPATHEFYVNGRLQADGSLNWRHLFEGSWSSVQGVTLSAEQQRELKQHNPRWFARYSSIFLFGAAFG